MFENCTVTGRNFENNFVIAGSIEGISRAGDMLGELGLTTQVVPVKYGFHTDMLDRHHYEFQQLTQEIDLKEPRIKLFSSMSRSFTENINTEHLWDVVRKPVYFSNTVNEIAQHCDPIFIDVGPSGTLATFIKYILSPGSKSIHLECMNPFGKNIQTMDNLMQSVTA